MGLLSQQARKLPHIPQLDGLRGIALALVVLHHVFVTWTWRGAPRPLLAFAKDATVGVDLFFVLSGFLITSILIRSKGTPGTLRQFYSRRILRIWPVYYVLLAVKCLETWWTRTPYGWARCTVFVQNFLPAWPASADFNQTWSLCVEEHFYLVWPLLVLLLPKRVLPFIAGGVVAISPLVRAFGLHRGANAKQLYTYTQYRLDGIALGSLLALLLAAGILDSALVRRLGWIILLAFLPAAVWVVTSLGEMQPLRVMFGDSFFALAFIGLFCLTLESVHFIRVLSLGPLRQVGKISYGLYMIHSFVFAFVGQHLLGVKGMFAGIGTSVVIAALSWRFFESPILQIGRRGPKRKQATIPDLARMTVPAGLPAVSE